MQPLLEQKTQPSPWATRTAPGKKKGPSVTLNAPSAEVQDLKDRYLAWMMATGYAEDSLKGAHSDLEWFFRFLRAAGISRIADVTPEVLADYSIWLRENKNRRNEGLTLSLAHVLHRLVGLKQFFKWLTKQMVILYDPAEDLEVPRVHRGLPHAILTQAEARRLLDAPDLTSPVGYRDKALLELLYATGIRTMELLRLKVEDVNVKGGTVFIRKGKGNKQRLIPVPPLSMGYVREYIERVRPRFGRRLWSNAPDQGFLFINYTGGHIDVNRLKEILTRHTKAAKIDKNVTALCLRHSIASHLLENGLDVRFIQEFLGHSRLDTTQIYAKVTLSGLRRSYNKTHPKEKRARGRKQILDEAQ
jgi:integrase/recombinase XerD